MGEAKWANIGTKIRLFTIFSSLVISFPLIAQDDSLKQSLTTSFIQKICGLNLEPRGLNQAQYEVFHHFLIEYDYSLRHCLTSSKGKIHVKNFGAPNLGQAGQNRA